MSAQINTMGIVTDVRVAYPRLGFSEIITVEVMPGESEIEAIVERGDAQDEWELV